MDTKDVYIVDTPEEQKAMGVAAAKGILKTLGIKWIEVEQPKPLPLKEGKWCISKFNERTKSRADVKVHLDALRKIGYGIWYEEQK